jgi:phosphoglycolate phosphatase-like HAD superfamily hydrolase
MAEIMDRTPEAAVIFDVDGPLLHLTKAEEDAFFAPFKALFGIDGLSRDWDSYRVRNDSEIIREVLERHFAPGSSPKHYDDFVSAYEQELEEAYQSGRLQVASVDGAASLLKQLQSAGMLALGTATANLECAARIRLQHADMWAPLAKYPGTADGGGHKADILFRVINDIGVPPDQVVFIGDNLNDLQAGERNGTHFIGFHVSAGKQQRLRDHGARHVTGDHRQTLEIIGDMLNLAL